MLKRNLRWIQVIWITLIVIIAYSDRVNFSIAAPLITKENGLNPAQLGIILSGFTFGYLLSNFPGGLLAQRFRSRLILTFALIGWSIATFFTGFAWSFASLLIVRILFGILEGPMAPNISKMIAVWVLPKESGVATGLWSAGVPLGIVLGNLIGAGLVSSFGWHNLFYIFGIAGIVMAILTWYFLRDYPKEHPKITQEELELIESSKSQFEVKAAPDSKGSTVRLLKDPWVWVFTLTYFLFTLIFWANLNWLPTYFIEARHSDLLKAGLNSSIPWIAMALGTIILCRLADTGKGYKSLWYAISLIAIGPFIAYAVITPSLTACLLSFSVATFFIGGAVGIGPAYIIDMYKVSDVPKVHGLVLTAGGLAGVIAPILVGFVVQFTHSFNYAYYFFSILAIIGGLIAFTLFSNEKKVRLEKGLISTVEGLDGESEFNA